MWGGGGLLVCLFVFNYQVLFLEYVGKIEGEKIP